MTTGSPLKMMENVFYFTFKALLSFCLEFLVMYKNGLIRKIRLILKILTSQPGWQTITIHILPDISRYKGNQAMKFGQLIEYNMQNIFFEKSYTKSGSEFIPTPLSKKSAELLAQSRREIWSLSGLYLKFKSEAKSEV